MSTCITKEPIGRRVLFALLCGLLLLAAPFSADATDPGSGGGIGGTGITSEGIGGTGISSFGVVQRFGSIYVNGREYLLNDTTAYRLDGHPGTVRNVHLGDVVLVRAQAKPDGRLTADSVHVRVALAGRIEKVNPHAGKITLLGQVVHVTAETRTSGPGAPRLKLAQLHAGDAVRISALARGNGRWVATRVVRAPATAFLVSGPVRAINRTHGHLTIGTRTLAASGPLTGIAIGEQVRAAGRYVRGTPVVMRVQPVLAAVGAPGTAVEMSGYVEARPDPGVLLANGVPLRYTARTHFSGGTAADARAGTAIAVRGVAEPDGSVLVNRVVLRADPMWVDLPSPLAPRPAASTRPESRERPDIERPDIERPDIERPEIERPEIELPEQPGG